MVRLLLWIVALGLSVALFVISCFWLGEPDWSRPGAFEQAAKDPLAAALERSGAKIALYDSSLGAWLLLDSRGQVVGVWR